MKVLHSILDSVGTGVLVVYFLPGLVAEHRDVWDNYSTYGFYALNLCVGWTGIGWIALMVWAAFARHSKPSKTPLQCQESSTRVVRTHNPNGTWT